MAIKGANLVKELIFLWIDHLYLKKWKNFLLIWINKKQLADDSVSETIICEKTKQLHSNLKWDTQSDEFKASSQWIDRFKK